jgi:DNA sulfur modification protein DndD
MNQQLTELDTEIKKTKQELNEYTVEDLKYQNSEYTIDSAARVQETLKVFRERLTLRKLNKLEEEVKNCFLYLLYKSDLLHPIAIDAKTFALSLYDLNGKAVPKHRLSSGEKQLTGRKQKLSPNVAQTGLIRRKNVRIPVEPINK